MEMLKENERGKSTAPQITTSAIPCSINMAPMIMEVEPVAHAVMVEVMGPVAPVMMEIFPPTILMQEFALVNGWGSLPPETHILSARITASRPPTAVLKVMATLGAMSSVISILLFASARWTTSIAWLKTGDVHSAMSRDFKKG